MQRGAVEWACLLSLAFGSLAWAGSQPSIDEDRLPPQARLINGVLVPVPDQIFRVLDTFQDANWNNILRPDLSALRPEGSSANVALSLGLVLGEGFLAISAKDSAEIRDLGRAAMRLSRALGVEKSVLRREKSVLDCVDQKDWASVRVEWSGVSEEVKAAMIEIKSESSSQLISLGGWLRGLEALSALASRRYSPSTAQLLRQPEMLGYFAEVVAGMESKLKKDRAVIEVINAITKLQPLMAGKKGDPLSEQEVREIRDISRNLVESLCTE